MAIGFFRTALMASVATVALIVASGLTRADDQLVLTNGSTITGQIVSVSGDSVSVASKTASGGSARIPYHLSDIKSVTMAVPPQVAQVKGADPKLVIAALEPLVKQYAGLPTPWVPEAMASLADAYGANSQDAQSTAMYAQISQFYPGSNFVTLAVAGNAKQLVAAGKIPEAIALMQPVIDQANKNLSPSPADGRLFASVFLVYGQALEAQKKLPQALEAYLTVKTMLYQNAALVEEAEHRAQVLRTANPTLGVD